MTKKQAEEKAWKEFERTGETHIVWRWTPSTELHVAFPGGWMVHNEADFAKESSRPPRNFKPMIVMRAFAETRQEGLGL